MNTYRFLRRNLIRNFEDEMRRNPSIIRIATVRFIAIGILVIVRIYRTDLAMVLFSVGALLTVWLEA